MTLDSFQRGLYYLNRRVPFQPFMIELQSGDRIHVRHPEAVFPLAIANGRLFVFRSTDHSFRLFETESVVQLIDRIPAQSPGAAS